MISYLIESLDSLSLQQEREKIIKQSHFDDALISYYDLEDTTLEKALEDLDTYSFLSPKKVIIIQKIESLKVDDIKDDFNHLLRYISSPNPDNLLIIEANKLNNTTKLTKDLKKVCEYRSIAVDIKKFIQSSLKDYQLENGAALLLENDCLGDLSKAANECEKLKNYRIEEKTISKKDIEELVVPKLGDSKDLTFDFSRSLALRHREDALRKYRELLSYQIEPFGIIGLVASQMRIIYQVKLLEGKNLSDKEIASTIGEKSDYRIKKTRELTRFYSEEDLLSIMQSLANMDYQMKTEDVDGNHLMEMFILNI